MVNGLLPGLDSSRGSRDWIQDGITRSSPGCQGCIQEDVQNTTVIPLFEHVYM